jgi:hypothetical protein
MKPLHSMFLRSATTLSLSLCLASTAPANAHYQRPIVNIAFSRGGNTIYSAAKDGEVRIWQAPPLNGLEASEGKKSSGARTAQ